MKASVGSSHVEGFTAYLASLNRSPATVRTYRNGVRPFLRWLAARGRAVPGAAPRDIEDYLAALAEEGRLRPSSVRVRRNAVRQFYRFLSRTGRAPADPAAGLSSPKAGLQLPRAVLSVEEVESLLAQPDTQTSEGIRDRAAAELLYTTGLRISELVGLDIADADTAKGLLTVRRGKGGKGRVVPLGNKACLWLRVYLKEVRPRWVRDKSGDALFLGRRGGRINLLIVERRLRAYGKKAGIQKPITPHVLRHSFASHLAANGASLMAIKEMLGHSWASTTQVYVHVAASEIRQMLDRCHPRERYAA